MPMRQSKVEPVEGTRSDNNLKSFSFDAITKKNSVLIIDGAQGGKRYLRTFLTGTSVGWSLQVFAGSVPST